MSVALQSTTAANGTSTSPQVAYPANIAAGDLIIATLFEQSAPTGTPAGFSLVGARVATTGVGISIYWKKADGTESGTNCTFTLGGSNNWRLYVSRITGQAFGSWSFVGYSTTSNTTAGSNVVAPNQGSVPANCLGWAAGAGYNGTNGTDTVSGTGWSLVSQGGYGSPNQTSAIAQGSSSVTGSCTFNLVNSYANHAAASFYIVDGLVLVGGGATWSWTGASSSILYKRLLLGAGGVWSWTGAAASLLCKRLLIGAGGVWSWTGAAASILYKRLLVGAGAVWSWTGAAANILRSSLLVGAGATWSWVGAASYRVRIFVLGGATWSWSGAVGNLIKFCLNVQEADRGTDSIVQSALRSAGTVSQEQQRSAATTEEEVLRSPEARC